MFLPTLETSMRYAKHLLLLILTKATLAWTAPTPYLYVDLNLNGAGMFSVFNYVCGVLHDYETHEYSGVEVNFGENSLYYDADYGPNWWEYYFERIQIGDSTNAPIKEVNNRYGKYANFNRERPRQEVNQLIQKYFKIKEPILAKVEGFVTENFGDYHIIGIHYRGTDKMTVAPKVPFPNVLAYVNKYIAANNIDHFKLFVATDEQPFIDFIEAAFPDQVLIYSTLHSEDGTPLHYRPTNHFLQGEEALIDSLLLSQSDVLIRTTSNLSLWSGFFNPTLPVIQISKRFNEN